MFLTNFVTFLVRLSTKKINVNIRLPGEGGEVSPTHVVLTDDTLSSIYSGRESIYSYVYVTNETIPRL